MRSVLKEGLITFTIALVLLTGALWQFRSALVSRHLSAIIELPVSIESVGVSWGELTLQGVQIHHNSQPNRILHALEVQTVRLSFRLWELFKKRPTIEHMELIQPTLGLEMYETGGSNNNWSTIFNRTLSAQKRKQYQIERITLNEVRILACNRRLCDQLIHPKPIALIAIEKESRSSLNQRETIELIARKIMEAGMSTPGFRNILDDAPPPMHP